MATIIEVHENKLEHLSEYAEKVVKYGKQLLECLDEVSNEKYAERYGKGKRRDSEWEREKEYPRYY